MAHEARGVEMAGRVKLFSSVQVLPKTDVLEPSTGDYLTDVRLDFRMMFKQSFESFRIELDPTLSWVGGEATGLLASSGLPLDQLPGTDTQRLFDWSNVLVDTKDHRVVSRIDRLSVSYRQPSWSLSAGRQAVSWGNGLAFQPLDLFSPFAPTTIDREFKPGVDSILFDALIGSSSELQLLYIDRQQADDLETTQTMAMKWHSNLGQIGFDLIVAEHLGDDFLAASLTVPVASSLLRVDASRLCDMDACYVSSVANMDYTVTVGSSLLYVYAEVYHSGFGLDSSDETAPDSLTARLQRGELFTTFKNYLSVGANVNWHPLWSQSLVFINNIEDRSGLMQTNLNFEPSDSTRMQFGVSLPFGEVGSEFGEKSLGEGITSGGSATLFTTLSFYF